MFVQIRNRYTDEVIYKCEAGSLREAVEECVKLGKSLAGASLAGANLADAYLADANLVRANLAGASLVRANLAGANLARVSLAGASLARVSLAGASLVRANLADANLVRANLAGASLVRANLAGANLAEAYLAGANLARVSLADAIGAEQTIAQTRILPEGSIYGWKKVKTPSGDGIVKLLIPEYAARSHAFGRKCRCEFAQVIEAPEGAYTDDHGPRTEYKVGEVVKPDKWDENWQEECSRGIHFFITRLEAENYGG